MANSTTKSGSAVKKRSATVSKRISRNGAGEKTARGKRLNGAGDGLKGLRMEVKSLKKLVLFQKAKQQLLRNKTIGPAQVDALLADYLKVVLTLTGTTAGSILLLENDHLVFRASSGPGSVKLIGQKLPVSEGIAGTVFRSGKTYISSDVSRDTQWSSRISAELRFPTQNILCAPLKTADKVIGVIEVINKKASRPFAREDREMLETLSDQLALDIVYATLLSESLATAHRRTMQMELAMALNSSPNQRQVRRQAIEAVTDLLDAEAGSLLLVDPRTRDLFFEVALGEKEEQVKPMRLKMGEGIAGWVAANDEPALVNDVQNDPRYFRKAQSITDFIARNMLCVPVRSKGRVIGVLQAINKKGDRLFNEEDLENCWTLSHQVAIALENAQLYAELKETFLNTAEALAAAVEKRDPYTGGHIKRVVEYSMAIARHTAEPLSDMEDLRLAAVLHDIGKIGIKDSVLLKPSRLDHEEIAHMREHPLVGEDILVHIEQMKSVRRIMRAHHERWDGTGYPDGLKGEQIPVHARIISIADTFDAITTDRPYRRAADWKTALEEIKRCSGREYDPVLVEAFVRACETGAITIIPA